MTSHNDASELLAHAMGMIRDLRMGFDFAECDREWIPAAMEHARENGFCLNTLDCDLFPFNPDSESAQ